MKDRRLSKSLCSVIVLKELPATIAIITDDKVTEIFYTSDDLCIFFDTPMQNILQISDNKRTSLQFHHIKVKIHANPAADFVTKNNYYCPLNHKDVSPTS